MGRRGPIEWLARSPDLNPLDLLVRIAPVCKGTEELFTLTQTSH
jgi:hypothetical protein